MTGIHPHLRTGCRDRKFLPGKGLSPNAINLRGKILRSVIRIRSWLTLIGQRFVLQPLWFLYRKDSRRVALSILTTGCHSIGSAAIFLLGGTTRDAEPIPILLRSGDVVIMSGPECRRAYHGQSMSHLESLQAEKFKGVPRILEGTTPPHLALNVDEHGDWEPYGQYIRTTRINLNVRQVFPRSFRQTW